MTMRIGCVGCGNMGGAILAGLARSAGHTQGQTDAYALCGYNRTTSRMRPLEEAGVQVMTSPLAVAENADIIILAVKPYQIREVVGQLRPALDANKVLVSVAAGITSNSLAQWAENACPVVRCMPNTPALVGMGVFALCLEDPKLSQSHKQNLLQVFGTLGQCVELAEEKFTAFSALIGAGPAYVFAMMQGLVQAGVTLGFTHAQSRQMVTALFAGSARMAEQDASPLGQLRDNVCSPGGLTIAGVNVLDRAGLTGLLVDAVLAADARGAEMERKGG
ncbi:MAG: pyrroline-5-carboxylate reductase [Desulfovibrio sp.]|uniref:pyrroline-5-carboxylate reductase n=1 Tax=Desulfovibrio sp. TaxID=885 RepID=UPI002A35DFE0|nr:pyrroline-5-carboxylate reductase [Desulfovibrio sp.]MDY0259921.1 pyrroline-5-carboxylate reductase [Desulfovibrio sp.]